MKLMSKIKNAIPRWLVMLIALFIIIALIGIIMRIVHYKNLTLATQQQAILTVATMQTPSGPLTEKIILPGNVEAWHEATLYARTSGYTIQWLVDIGAIVKKDQLLATLSAPEIDAELRQAEADLIAAIEQDKLAQITAKRWQHLLKSDSVSHQETDEKITQAKASAALVKSMQAHRDKLRDLVNFQQIRAPFEGIIMSRTTDIGRLIDAGSGGQQLPLFRIVQANKLRIYVKIPQIYASFLLPGLKVNLFFPQFPGQLFQAKLLDTAKAIDINSRTLLTQFETENKHYQLLPGSYTEVHLLLPTNPNSVRIPVNTLIFRAEGMQVATVQKNNTALLKSIQIGRDFGSEVEVIAGLKKGESIVLNPPDALTTGQKVRVVSHQTPLKEQA